MYLTCSYLRILMGIYFRKNLGHRGLVWFGVATQIGSLVGAFITFILTNSFQLFKERNNGWIESFGTKCLHIFHPLENIIDE
jgi:hypothetical protein